MRRKQPQRLFRVRDVLSGRDTLADSQHRYICLSEGSGGVLRSNFARLGVDARLDRMLSAVEMLESRGWALVSVELGGAVAYLRRVDPRPGG